MVEYNSEEVKQFLKMYRDIYNLPIKYNSTDLYLSTSIEELQRNLQFIKGFPKEFYSGDIILEGDVKKSISLLEEAIGYHKKDLEAAKLNSNKDNMLKH
jgi:hypothetical protein